MNELEFESAPPPTRPSTITVVALLALAAATLSYLASYAIANAMVAADLLKAWPREDDPRPRWFAIGFGVLITVFGIVAAVARRSAARHLRRIEEMEEESGDSPMDMTNYPPI
jgi:hypothetical protein